MTQGHTTHAQMDALIDAHYRAEEVAVIKAWLVVAARRLERLGRP